MAIDLAVAQPMLNLFHTCGNILSVRLSNDVSGLSIAALYLDMAGEWKLPPLVVISTAPNCCMKRHLTGERRNPER
jgi:hypothetical protein